MIETLAWFYLHSDSLSGRRSVIEAFKGHALDFWSSIAKKNRSAVRILAVLKL
jgi:hypothetical protein